MKALFGNRIYNILEASEDLLLEGVDGKQFAVDYGDEQLVVDPTDAEVAGATNLAEWYGVDGERLSRLRLVLRGELPLSAWRA